MFDCDWMGRTTVCVLTAGAYLQSGGDPLVFRTDVVTGSATAEVRMDALR